MYIPTQRAAVTIGALECKGQTDLSPNGGSCKSLRMQGRPSGYYLLDTNNGTEQAIETNKYVELCSKLKKS